MYVLPSGQSGGADSDRYSTYVVLNKTKGWYIVQKDPEGMGNIVADLTKAGWVPAGCLLELSSPILGMTVPGSAIPVYPGLSRIPPTSIVSSSYPGIVLMDYDAQGEDELTLREGEPVNVYKKYCHW